MRLFFRTEASSQIGMGHFMRCFALAEEARAQDVAVTFIMTRADDAVVARCDQIGAEVAATGAAVASDGDIAAMVGLGLTREDWLVIDSYAADTGYIAFQSKAAQVAVMDDLALLEHFDCDLLINPAMAASEMGYAARTGARLLLGAPYALIRREFIQVHSPHTEGRSVAVMFGGADPTGLTGMCAEILHEALPDATVNIVVGPANTHTESLLSMQERLLRLRIYPSPDSVAEVLAGSDLVVTAAGGTIGEVAAMGLPALVLVVYDNQMAALKACPFPAIDARAGLPDDLGERVRALVDDPARRTEIAAHAHAIVDGQGPARILEAMRHV